MIFFCEWNVSSLSKLNVDDGDAMVGKEYQNEY
jgi:hypothetical protein